MRKNLAWLGVVVFAVSWFIDVHQKPIVGYDGPPGWRAFRVAFDMLQGEEKGGVELKSDDTKRILLGATSLTNGVMLLAAVLLFLSLRGIPRWLGFVLLLCAGLNFGWLYHNDAEFREGLRLGYWLWTGSFVVVGLSSLLPSQD